MFFLAFLPFFPGPLELPSTTGFFSAFGGLPGFFKPLLFPPFCSPSTPFAGAMFPPVTPRCNNNKKKRERCKSPLKTLTRNTPTPPKQQQQQKRRKSEDVRFTTSTLFFPSFPCFPFTRELSRPLLVPRSHLTFTVHWLFLACNSSQITRKFSCPLPVPCSHFNFIVVFLVHTSIYHPFLVPCSHINFIVLWLFLVQMRIFPTFSCSLFTRQYYHILLLVTCSHFTCQFSSLFLLPQVTCEIFSRSQFTKEILYFTNFWSPCSPREFHNLSSIFLFPNHRWNFTFYHHYYNMWLSSLCGLLQFEKT